MTREGAVMTLISIAVALLFSLVWAWLRRTRRDGGIVAPTGEGPAAAAVLADFRVLYVATTKHGEPLERLAIAGLGFRSKADLSVTDAGIAVDLTGRPRIFLDLTRLVAASQATVAIDRVVEPDGLVRIDWRTDDGTVVDSYFRPQDASARSLADSIRRILTPTPTGTDA
jgi:hypothetical protein